MRTSLCTGRYYGDANQQWKALSQEFFSQVSCFLGVLSGGSTLSCIYAHIPILCQIQCFGRSRVRTRYRPCNQTLRAIGTSFCRMMKAGNIFKLNTAAASFVGMEADILSFSNCRAMQCFTWMPTFIHIGTDVQSAGSTAAHPEVYALVEQLYSSEQLKCSACIEQRAPR